MAKILRGLNGREYPVELQPGFSRDGTRTDTPASREAVALLARRSRPALRTGGPLRAPISR